LTLLHPPVGNALSQLKRSYFAQLFLALIVQRKGVVCLWL
jgi:hypothetical protein